MDARAAEPRLHGARPGRSAVRVVRDGLTFLWLVAFVLALVLEVELAVHGGTS